MRGDVDVRGTMEITFLPLLAVPIVPPPEKDLNPHRASSFAFFTNCYDRQGAPIQHQHRIGFEEGEKLDVVSQCLDESSSSLFALRIHPSL